MSRTPVFLDSWVPLMRSPYFALELRVFTIDNAHSLLPSRAVATANTLRVCVAIPLTTHAPPRITCSPCNTHNKRTHLLTAMHTNSTMCSRTSSTLAPLNARGDCASSRSSSHSDVFANAIAVQLYEHCHRKRVPTTEVPRYHLDALLPAPP